MKDWYFKRQLQSSNVCVGLYTTPISDFVFGRRRCRFPNSLRGCLHEPYKKGWPYSARSRVLFEILIKNCLRLHEKRASPPRRDLAIAYPRSRLVGLEISHINATEGASPPSRAE